MKLNAVILLTYNLIMISYVSSIRGKKECIPIPLSLIETVIY